MGNIWNNLHANFGRNRPSDVSLQAKKLKCQSEVQTALAQKLIAVGE